MGPLPAIGRPRQSGSPAPATWAAHMPQATDHGRRTPALRPLAGPCCPGAAPPRSASSGSGSDTAALEGSAQGWWAARALDTSTHIERLQLASTTRNDVPSGLATTSAEPLPTACPILPFGTLQASTTAPSSSASTANVCPHRRLTDQRPKSTSPYRARLNWPPTHPSPRVVTFAPVTHPSASRGLALSDSRACMAVRPFD